MNITIYCGANSGQDPEFRHRADELGRWMAHNGHRLIYGAGRFGTMGTVADAILDNGGKAKGITPNFFVLAEETHQGLTEVQVTETLPERRVAMIEQGDAFIALPGGTGTIDEITEVMSLTRLGRLLDSNGKLKPIMIYNINGFYDHFFSFLDRVLAEDFFTISDRNNIHEVKSIQDIEEVISGLQD